MSSKTTVGIDIGTHQVRVVVAQNQGPSQGHLNDLPKILGGGAAESKGLRHGYIINGAECLRSIKAAVATAEKSSGERIRRAYVSVGGIGLTSTVSSGQAAVTRGDQSITELDLDLAIETAEEAIPAAFSQNGKIFN